jgi:hypothetical protein
VAALKLVDRHCGGETQAHCRAALDALPMARMEGMGSLMQVPAVPGLAPNPPAQRADFPWQAVWRSFFLALRAFVLGCLRAF